MEQIQRIQNLKIYNQETKYENIKNYKVLSQTKKLTEKLNKVKKQKHNHTISSIKSHDRGQGVETLKAISPTQSHTKEDFTVDDQQGNSSSANERYKVFTFPSKDENFSIKLDDKSPEPIATRNEIVSFQTNRQERPVTQITANRQLLSPLINAKQKLDHIHQIVNSHKKETMIRPKILNGGKVLRNRTQLQNDKEVMLFSPRLTRPKNILSPLSPLNISNKPFLHP